MQVQMQRLPALLRKGGRERREHAQEGARGVVSDGGRDSRIRSGGSEVVGEFDEVRDDGVERVRGVEGVGDGADGALDVSPELHFSIGELGWRR